MLTAATANTPDILEELWDEDFESLQSYFPDEPPKSLEEVGAYCPVEVYIETFAEVNDRLADNLDYLS